MGEGKLTIRLQDIPTLIISLPLRSKQPRHNPSTNNRQPEAEHSARIRGELADLAGVLAGQEDNVTAAHGRQFEEADDAVGAEDEVGGGGGAGGDGGVRGGFGCGSDDTEVAGWFVREPHLLFGHDG